MKPVTFTATIESLAGMPVVRIPQSASDALPSRGQTMVVGTINGVEFRSPLEPDGRGSHWFSPSAELLASVKAKPGKSIELSIESSKDWVEPEIPADLFKALQAHPQQHELWQNITPMARWDWIRWIRATNNQETRAKRVDVAMSKMSKGMRRPCCFNRNVCTVPEVSKSGALLPA